MSSEMGKRRTRDICTARRRLWLRKVSSVHTRVYVLPIAEYDCIISAAWDFVEKHQSEISWDLVTLCPPLVSIPFMQYIALVLIWFR